jgi:hypothetical protein
MLRDVIEARVTGGYRVFLRFEDGIQGEVDLSTLVVFEGVFAPLRDHARFAELRVGQHSGTIEWPNGADIAPETLYAALVRQTPGAIA